MEIGRKRNTIVLTIGVFFVMILTFYVLGEPLQDFVNALVYRLKEFNLVISRDVNQDAKLLLWTRQNQYKPIIMKFNSTIIPVQFNL